MPSYSFGDLAATIETGATSSTETLKLSGFQLREEEILPGLMGGRRAFEGLVTADAGHCAKLILRPT